MVMTFRILLCMLIVLTLGRAAWPDDHSGTVAISVSPRVEARIGDKQLLLLYSNRQLFEDTAMSVRIFGGIQPVKLAEPRIVVFLEGYADAIPIEGAMFEAVINFLPEELTEAAPGVYLSGPVVLGGGRNEIELNYTIGKESGTLPLVLLVPGGATSGTGAVAVEAPPPVIPSWTFALAALITYAAVLWLYIRRRQITTPTNAETKVTKQVA